MTNRAPNEKTGFCCPVPYDWQEIQDWLDSPRDPMLDVTSLPDEPTRVCESCGQPMEWIYWQSSRWTWEHLCGRGGTLEICRPCQAWFAMARCTVMN